MSTRSPVTELDPYRLPRQALPRRYDLAITPDLGAATFNGEVEILLEVVDEIDRLVLNSADLEIGSCAVDGVVAGHHLEVDTERLFVTVESPLAPGEHRLRITFSGVLNDKLRGFYRSTYVDDDGIERVIATTQMQSTDCRRAFPCWDEPDFKAVFGITLVVEPGLLAISNGREIERTTIETDGVPAVRIRFADTISMSSYLVAMVVGPLEATDPVDVDGVPLRIVHVPGKSSLTGFGLDIAAFSLRWFRDYYGIDYPGDKLDLVALPDFAAGAMENIGCVTFRENVLLVDPDRSTQAEQQLVADVVAHELAHMWFGDLVTMRWWNGIWLNEAFATFMEIAACDAYRPSWNRWTYFGLERTVAFDTDSLASTRSVEYEVRSPADCEGMFDVLTYQKGAALLRMLEQYLGADRFRDGVRNYLTKNAFGSTETADLWDAIEETTGEPVRRLMDSWIWQPGYPLVGARLEVTDLVLDQERFGFDTTTDPTHWVVPVIIGNGSTTLTALLDGDEVRVALPAPAEMVVVNAGGHGFFRVRYDETLRRRLDRHALDRLDTLERYNLVDDAWNGVVAGRMSAADFLEFIGGFSAETSFAVWQIITIALRGLGRLVDGEAHDALRARIADLVRPTVERLGRGPLDDMDAKVRGLLIGALAVLGGDHASQLWCREVLEAADGTGDSVGGEGAVDAELVAAATAVVAAVGDAADYERLLAGVRRAATPQDQLRNLYALAEFDDAALIGRTCELAMSDEVKTQNAPFLLRACIANRHHGEAAWDFVRQHWDDATARFPTNTIVRMIDSVKLLNRPDQQRGTESFFAEHPIPQAAETLRQVLERQRVNVALRAREERPFSEWLLA